MLLKTASLTFALLIYYNIYLEKLKAIAFSLWRDVKTMAGYGSKNTARYLMVKFYGSQRDKA
jgi:hypothetical protein